MERVVYHATWCPFCIAFMEHFKILEPEGKEEILDDMSNPLWVEKKLDLVLTVIEYENGVEKRRLSAQTGIGITKNMYENWMKA